MAVLQAVGEDVGTSTEVDDETSVEVDNSVENVVNKTVDEVVILGHPVRQSKS